MKIKITPELSIKDLQRLAKRAEGNTIINFQSYLNEHTKIVEKEIKENLKLDDNQTQYMSDIKEPDKKVNSFKHKEYNSHSQQENPSFFKRLWLLIFGKQENTNTHTNIQLKF